MFREELLCLIESYNYQIRTRIINSDIKKNKFYLSRNLLVFLDNLDKSLNLISNINNIVNK